jgi:hypothetical protein
LIFSRSAGLRGKLAPVRKSFDFNPLATLAQAGLRPARNKEERAWFILASFWVAGAHLERCPERDERRITQQEC